VKAQAERELNAGMGNLCDFRINQGYQDFLVI
jgi:hypothetical protein